MGGIVKTALIQNLNEVLETELLIDSKKKETLLDMFREVV